VHCQPTLGLRTGLQRSLEADPQRWTQIAEGIKGVTE